MGRLSTDKRIVRAQPQRVLRAFSFARLAMAPHSKEHDAVRQMCPGIPVVETERRARLGARLQQNIFEVSRELRAAHQHPGKQAVGLA